MLPLLGLHAALGVVALLVARPADRRAFAFVIVAPIATLAWALTQMSGVLDGATVDESWQWVEPLGLTLDLRLDGFGLLMLALVSGIGALVFVYALRYFGRSAHAGRAAGYLVMFSGAMVGLVLADNLLLLYVCWELTSVTSYLLIGLDDRKDGARHAALHAFLVTGMGGLVMLCGFVILAQQAGTYRISGLLADPPSGRLVEVAVVLVLVGAFTKSAQYPFHSWLPEAMVAPTPISAYLHSAAMVKAGVYLIARLAPAFAAVGIWRPLIIVVGLTTMIAGGLRALRPTDLKQVLAFGTISQLGFLVVLLGIGRPEATAAGCALLLAHGVFKASLFMVVGIVDHQTGTRELGQLALGAGWGPTKVVAVVSAASMAAVPPLAGFIAKESAYGALLDGPASDRIVLAGVVAGSILTVAYSCRIVAGLVRPALVAERPGDTTGTPPSALFLAPAALLAVLSVIGGLFPATWSSLVDAAANALDAASHAHLALWHGINTALVLSLVTLACGAALFAARRPVAAAQERLAPPVSGTEAYDGAVRGLNRAARLITGVAQPGSLPIYGGVVLTTAAVVPLLFMVSGPWWPGWPDLIGTPAYIPIVALLVTCGLAATLARRRFTSALLLGAVGYGMALVFVVQGAPDLALTQFAIETLSVVLFILVLRRLPEGFERRGRVVGGRLFRLGAAASVGLFVFIFGIAAAGARTAAPVSDEMVEDAVPEGGGSNVVNVILVDFRGLDTLGEITVLVAAGIGAVALARAGRRPPGLEPTPDDATPEADSPTSALAESAAATRVAAAKERRG